MAIGLTVLMLVGGTVVIALVGVLPAALQFIGLESSTQWLLLVLEWPLLIAVVMLGLAVLYRYAPDRHPPRWRWVSPGAIVATVLWLLGSVGFTVYVSHFNSYDKTYGSLGGVVVMLTWLYLSAFVALFGAVINAQSERQTQADSTDRAAQAAGQPQSLRRGYRRRSHVLKQDGMRSVLAAGRPRRRQLSASRRCRPTSSRAVRDPAPGPTEPSWPASAVPGNW